MEIIEITVDLDSIYEEVSLLHEHKLLAIASIAYTLNSNIVSEHG